MRGLRKKDDSEQKMIVVGHAYGRPGTEALGLDPTLVGAMPTLSSIASVIALTGDITRRGSQESFSAAIDQLRPWRKVIVAPGNHDVGTSASRSAFENSFGHTYGISRVGEASVIWLDTESADSAVSTPQIRWLKRTLSSPTVKRASSLIVLTHHLVWADSRAERNQRNAGPRDTTWQRDPNRLHRVLSQSDIPILVISGDVGAWPENGQPICKERGSITYVASGIGGYESDIALIVSTGDRLAVTTCRLRDALLVGSC
jgi:hypothetical protein